MEVTASPVVGVAVVSGISCIIREVVRRHQELHDSIGLSSVMTVEIKGFSEIASTEHQPIPGDAYTNEWFDHRAVPWAAIMSWFASSPQPASVTRIAWAARW
jgi:hypothetical protein